MAIENAPYIAGLNTSIPANTDPRAEGAAQIRGSKTAVKNTFPNVNGAVTATADRMNTVFDNPSQVPIGLVAMWINETLPVGWADCDGTIVNGFQTPDLRSLFLRGVDDNNRVGSTGGSDTALLTDHVLSKGHKLTELQMPAHSHTGTYEANKDNGDNSGGEFYLSPTGDKHRDNKEVTVVTDSKGGGQEHSHVLEDIASNPFDNRPSFYSIKYICYVGK